MFYQFSGKIKCIRKLNHVWEQKCNITTSHYAFNVLILVRILCMDVSWVSLGRYNYLNTQKLFLPIYPKWRRKTNHIGERVILKEELIVSAVLIDSTECAWINPIYDRTIIFIHRDWLSFFTRLKKEFNRIGNTQCKMTIFQNYLFFSWV